MLSGIQRMMRLTNGNNIVSISKSRRDEMMSKEEQRERLRRTFDLRYIQRPSIEKGDKIWALDRTFEVGEVLHCEYWGDRPVDTEVCLNAEYGLYYTRDEWGYNCEFLDVDGGYHS